MHSFYSFSAKGHDDFIDFIKGFAIISVVLLHNLGHTALNRYGLFSLWIGQAVPLFILIQSVNTYKKNMGNKSFEIISFYKANCIKTIRRVLIPFCILQIFLIPIYFTLFHNDQQSFFKTFVCEGGFGPGAYYPWIYLQIFLILPLVIFMYKKVGMLKAFIFVAIIGAGLEFMCNSMNFSETSYRLIAVRYVFMTICGVYVTERGFKLNKKMFFLSFIGICFIVLDAYTSYSLYPLTFKSLGFPGQHWPSYFYVSIMLVYVLKFIYNRIHLNLVAKAIVFFGRDSYSIFLIQMFIFWFMRNMHWDSYNISIKTFVFVLISTFCSLAISTAKFYLERKNRGVIV